MGSSVPQTPLASGQTPRVVLRARVAVLGAIGAAVCALLLTGCDPQTVTAATLTAACGSVEIGSRLTTPYPAPWTRILVLVVVLILVIVLLGTGHSPLPSVGVVLVAVGYSAKIAVQLTELPPASLRLPS
jgi:hypothetical protein